VAASLKRLGLLGMTSIMVIHQPRYSLFTLIDDVLLLGRGGSTVYLGPAAEVKAYFESLGFSMPEFENPADWFMDIISGTVENKSSPNFSQEALFDSWTRHSSQPSSGLPRSGTAGRSLTCEDAAAVLRDALDQEWDKINSSQNGVMEEEELQELLATCSAVIPDVDVVRDLMYRMAGEGAESVTKKQFLAYLCSLGEEIAHDSSSPREGGSPHRDASGDPLSRSSSSSSDCTDEEVGGVEEEANDFMWRRTPGCFKQLRTMMVRRIVQWWRMQRQRLLFLGALIFGASFFGVLDRYWAKQLLWDATPLLYLHTAMALLLSIFSLRIFGHDQPVFWRERARGANMIAHFSSRVLINCIDLVILAFAFTAVYYIIRQPAVPYWCWMTPFLFTAVGASGWGYLVSNIVSPANGPFVVTLVMFCTCALLGQFTNLAIFLHGGLLEVFIGLVSLTRWTVAMNFVYGLAELRPDPTEVKAMYELALQKSVYEKRDFGIGRWATAACAVFVQTLLLYVASFVFMRFRNRHKLV